MYQRFVKGDYVVVGIKNEFNQKVGYWISKKGMTIACYCFSLSESEAKRINSLDLDPYILLFQTKFENKTASSPLDLDTSELDLPKAKPKLKHRCENVLQYIERIIVSSEN